MKRKINCWLFPFDMFLTPSISFEKIMNSQINKRVSLIKAGYPRNSFFYDSNKLDENNKKVRQLFKISSDEKIILYLPTFRDKNSDDYDFQKLIANNEFIEVMNKTKTVLIQKKHFSNASNKYLNAHSKYVINVDNEISSQELLAAADILITDYSSCMFDYLILNRPIIQFVYDYDYYSKHDRGLYYPIDDVACGACVYDEDALIKQIGSYLNDTSINENLRIIRKKEYMTYDLNNSSETVYKTILDKIKTIHK